MTPSCSSTVYVLQSGGASGGGVATSGGSVSLKRSASPRVSLGGVCASEFGPDVFYNMPLLGRKLEYTMDLSSVSCACNAAVYFVAA